MSKKTIYLAFSLIGLVAPYYFFVTFLITNGLNGKLFLQQLFGTPISSFFAVDLLISCVIFVGYMSREASRHSIRNSWVYFVALCLVGLSFAWPLLLLAIESKTVETASAEEKALGKGH